MTILSYFTEFVGYVVVGWVVVKAYQSYCLVLDISKDD